MSEGSQNFESFSGAPGRKEKVTESFEQFSEQYRKTRAAIKQIKEIEDQKKQRDTSLAGIIVQFLQQKDKTAFFLLLSRLTACNIPSDFLLALLALIFRPAFESVYEKVQKEVPQELDETMKTKNSLFHPEEKKQIDLWMKNIVHIAHKEQVSLLRTALDAKQEVNGGLVRLFAMVLRDFLESLSHENIRMESLEIFGKGFLEKVFQKIAKDIPSLQGDRFSGGPKMNTG
jgi:hypothetical protein